MNNSERMKNGMVVDRHLIFRVYVHPRLIVEATDSLPVANVSVDDSLNR